MRNQVFKLSFAVSVAIQVSFLLSCLNIHSAHADPYEVRWRKLADKIDLGITKLPEGFFPGEITLIKTALDDYQPRVVRAPEYNKRRASVTWLAERAGAPICINANFFDPDGHPLGLVVSRGVKHRSIHQGGSTLTGAFIVFRDRAEIMQRSQVGTAYGLEAVQAGPRLVSNGVPIQGIDKEKSFSRRSGLCLTKKRELILFAVTSLLRGASLTEMSKVLVHSDIQCEDALNLDGGGSSQLYVSSKLDGAAPAFEGIELAGRDDIPVALCLFPRK